MTQRSSRTQVTSLAITAQLWVELTAALEDDDERAAVLAVRVVSTLEGTVLLGRTLAWAPDNCYLDRSNDGLSLTSHGWVPAARASVADGSLPVFVHTHPRGRGAFSHKDDLVDQRLAESMPHLGSAGPYVSVLVSGSADQANIIARSCTIDGFVEVPKVRVVGDSLDLRIWGGDDASTFTSVFDRQIRVFGSDGQQTLRALHVGVVGAGGTGSAVCEQLARLGVGTVTLIDDDVVTHPTPTRGYGTTMADLGRPKATVVAESMESIGLGTRFIPIVASIADPGARSALANADVVFSCVDGHGGRLVLNRWAYAHLAPVVDIAILVTSADGRVAGIDGRVTWLSPGAACLLCRGRLDASLAYAEMLNPEERRRLAGEGYVKEAETVQPAIVTLTSLMASLATTELIHRLFSLGDSLPTEILARLSQRELRLNRVPARPGCFCTSADFLGRGTESPHLDLLWPA